MAIETIHLRPLTGKTPYVGSVLKKVLTPAEAAALVGMDHRTLIRWARSGYAPGHALGEGRRRMWRFFDDELIAWVESQSNTFRTAA
jgi:excisionase family DNA binding protein